MRLVVLTNAGSPYGKRLLTALSHYTIPLAGIVVVQQSLRYHWRRFRSVQRRIGLVDTAYFSVLRMAPGWGQEHARTWRGIPVIRAYADLGCPVMQVRGTNSPQAAEAMTQLRPDLLLLGHTGIVRRPILDIPSVGTLNSHPGILPHYRGIDCVQWALYNDDIAGIGASVHWVDTGIDTGPVVDCQRYVFSGQETVASLRQGVQDLAIELLARTAGTIGQDEVPEGVPQDTSTGRQYFKIPRAQERQARTRLAAHVHSLGAP